MNNLIKKSIDKYQKAQDSIYEIQKISVLVHRSGVKVSGNAPHYYSRFSLKKV